MHQQDRQQHWDRLQAGSRGRGVPGREPPCTPDTLRGVTQITRNLEEWGGVQERFHEEGATRDQPGMPGKILLGSREQN